MKAQFTVQHLSILKEPPARISRARAAYLLRAARSRRRGNLSHIPSAYIINDSNHVVAKVTA